MSVGAEEHGRVLDGLMAPWAFQCFSNQVFQSHVRFPFTPFRGHGVAGCGKVLVVSLKQEIKKEAAGEAGHSKKLSNAASDKERDEGTRRHDSYEDDSVDFDSVETCKVSRNFLDFY